MLSLSLFDVRSCASCHEVGGPQERRFVDGMEHFCSLLENRVFLWMSSVFALSLCQVEKDGRFHLEFQNFFRKVEDTVSLFEEKFWELFENVIMLAQVRVKAYSFMAPSCRCVPFLFVCLLLPLQCVPPRRRLLWW